MACSIHRRWVPAAVSGSGFAPTGGLSAPTRSAPFRCLGIIESMDRELLRCLCHQERASSSQARTEAAGLGRMEMSSLATQEASCRVMTSPRLPSTTACDWPSLKSGRPTAPSAPPASWTMPWPTIAAWGVRIERVLTDNGKVFDSGLFVRLCEQHQIKRLHTRYCRPQTNGKAEPFVQTALREWA